MRRPDPNKLLIAGMLLLCLLRPGTSNGQSRVDSILDKLDPQKLASVISKKAEQLEKKLLQKSLKVLEKMQQQEEKLWAKMLKGKDSLTAKIRLAEIKDKYASIKDPTTNSSKQYIPRLDSLNTTLKYLSENNAGREIKGALAKTKLLQDQFQRSEQVRQFVKERKEQLKDHLEKLGMIRELKQINKQVYYYSAQIKEYKDILNDPKKIERKALELLAKTKLWKDFFRKNSMLASLFRIPDIDQPGNMASLTGLQTRSQVNNLIQQQIIAAGPNATQQIQANIQAAQSQLTELKNKVLRSGGSSSNTDLPDGFKPNNQKTKSFLQRLEYGANVQTQKANFFFPVTSDLGLSLGYKLNDRSIIGIGASYKMGWGRGWNDISISHQGVGLRSYADWKVKGSFWISGGYEQNYRSAYGDFAQLRDRNQWQSSGLLGISKVVSVKSKVFKKTKVMLLWDFLSYEQVPRTQPLVFRIGYNLK